MAHECQDLSTRVAVVDQNVLERLIYETAFTHFKSHKVEISDAIKTTFPFLEILRDRGFITDELYKESEEAWKKMSPVQKVVYDVLCVLEEKFDLSLMKILFSKGIVSKYPDLNDVREGFRNVIQEIVSYQESNGRERAKNIQLSLEQGVDENLYQNLTWLFPEHLTYNALPEIELPEQLCELPEQTNAVEMGTASDNDALEHQQASEQRAQVSKPAVTSEDSAAPGNGAESPVASTSAVKRRPESTDLRTPPTSGKKVCKKRRTHEESPKLSADQASRGSCGSAVSTGPGEKGKDCGPRAPGHQAPGHQAPGHQAPGHQAAGHRESEFAPVSLSPHTTQEPVPALISGTMNPGNNSASENAKKKRRPKKQEKESVNFSSETLHVTCGEMEGTLYKNLLEQGATTSCIKTNGGKWFTPREFEIEGGREKSCNWKLSIRCGGRTLRWLMEHEYLPKPPSKSSGKKKLRKSKPCEICQHEGTLFCCDTCSRSFHENCHLPPVETNKFVTCSPSIPFQGPFLRPCTPPTPRAVCPDGKELGDGLEAGVRQFDPNLQV